MTKAFVSYHHDNDQYYKEHLSWLARRGAFEDCSVKVGDIDAKLGDEKIRRIIRDERLRDTKVTILLCGTETRFRKHVDWELKSSMINGKKNKRSGILVIDLPTTRSNIGHTALPGEKEAIYSDYTGDWNSLEKKADFKSQYRDMPERIIDNLVAPEVRMSVVQWSRIANKPQNLKFLVDATARVAATNNYDLSRPMRMRDAVSTLLGRLLSG